VHSNAVAYDAIDTVIQRSWLAPDMSVKGETFGMDSVVIEHVPIADLPQQWREKLAEVGKDGLVTVRIDQEAAAVEAFADDPLFGMWRDHAQMVDVAGYIRKLHAARFNHDGSQPE
jgi:hypothetical protein